MAEYIKGRKCEMKVHYKGLTIKKIIVRSFYHDYMLIKMYMKTAVLSTMSSSTVTMNMSP